MIQIFFLFKQISLDKICDESELDGDARIDLERSCYLFIKAVCLIKVHFDFLIEIRKIY